MSRLQKAIQVAAKLRVEEEVRPVMAERRPAAPGGLERLLEVDPLPATHPLLAAWNGREEAAGEAYRKLRSLVVKLTRGKEFRNLLMVTSSLAAEGKSLTTLNLALALAQEYDHSVVLVDADMRKPSVHHYLGIAPEVGLSHCLKDGVTLDRALIKTGLGKLVVLPAGEAVADPVELLASGRMREILHELKNRYPDRYVLVDTPPVLPFADAQVIANFVDAVLFVVREGGPKPEEVQEALASLKGARLLGAVYNDAESFGQRGRYYYQR